MVAGRPVSIQSPAMSSPSIGVVVPGRGGASGASENVDRFSRTTTALRSRARRAAGRASRSSCHAISVSASLVIETMVSAPLEMSERCDTPPPRMALRSKTHWKLRPGKPINGSDIEAAMGETRDPAKLKEMWVSWHNNVGAPMRADYTKLVALANDGSKELGYDDTGAMWRAGYDMTPAEFEAETDRLWQQVKPLYDDLHCYVRGRLQKAYGADKVPDGKPLPASMLTSRPACLK